MPKIVEPTKQVEKATQEYFSKKVLNNIFPPKRPEPVTPPPTDTELTLLKKDSFLKAFSVSAANISHTCDKVGISRQNYYNWIEDDADFKSKVNIIQEGLIDLAETMLQSKIRGGDVTCLIFFLKTKGKARGYIERSELTGKDGEKLEGPIIFKPEVNKE